MQYYLAIDIGASGGRHILGSYQNGKLITEEMYRFENGMTEKNGTLVWDWERLFSEIKAGMRRCKEAGKLPVSVGVDTWGVDFVLLDQNKELIGDAVAYRDSRTQGADALVQRIISDSELYAVAGLQKQPYNTIYQLMALKEQHPEQLEQAAYFLMIPDFFHYLLSGKMSNEYTEASTSGLLHAEKRVWDLPLIEALGLPTRLFGALSQPGTDLGSLSDAVAEEVGFQCHVVLPATHDTASAVMAVPAQEQPFAFLSSGTWSLLGTEAPCAVLSPAAQKANFTNEGGYQGTYRFLKNIMGLWMIQSVRKELGKQHSYAELCDLADQVGEVPLLDVNDHAFLAPSGMIEAIQKACALQGRTVTTPGELAACIYRSLAACYAEAITELESITNLHFEKLYIVGGGSQADYLNRLTAQSTKRQVFAGPAEGTAIGNLCAQMIAAGEFADIQTARQVIAASFDVRKIEL